MPVEFDWRRFWCVRGESINLSDGGFLYDPEAKYGEYVNGNLVTFGQLAEEPCLALLGEPGIGKSWTLRLDGPEVQGSVRESELLLYRDLRSYGDEGRLVRDLFESEETQCWRSGDGHLQIFLDSLDECMLRIDHVAALLADELHKLPAERLRLRIACRTLPWPMFLEQALVKVFGSCGAYEMAPLRRRDVRIAAEQSQIADPAAFLGRIDELDVSSLAIKPVTLKFLLSTYKRNGDFPKNHLDLYEKGCRILAEESSPTLQAAGRRGRLTVDERLAIASRIAAATQLGNRFAVYTGLEADAAAPEDVTLAELAGGVEKASRDVPASEDALREVLNTGLFSARGPNRMGWAHLTYAEFLTARCVKDLAMPIGQIRPLIFHPSNQGQKLVPQLHEVAAWMSVVDPQVLEVVADSDPEALLGAAAASLTNEQRQTVVDSLLRQASEGRTLHLRWGLIGAYHKLNHPGLAGQLRSYLKEPTRVLGARHIAISIARACAIRELGPELADIALNSSVDGNLRSSAAAAAAEMGSVEVKGKLRPLAFEEVGDDPDDELKGSGLKALWPDLISAEELLGLLTPPKRQNLSGTYSSFFYNYLVQGLKVTDLPVALAWFSKQGHRMRLIGPIDGVMDKLVLFAWDHLGEPGVDRALAEALFSRVRLHDELINGDERGAFYKKVQGDHKRRRAVLENLLPHLNVDQTGALFTSGRAFLSASDCKWYVGRALGAAASEPRSVDARLARLTLDAADPRAMSTLYHGCQANEALNEECGNIFRPVLLDSEEAKYLREQYKQEQEWKTPKLLHPTPAERVEKDLQNIEKGRVAEWFQLTLDLGLEATSTHYAHNTELNLTTAPGWKPADTSMSERILRAAVRYVEEGDPENEKWFHSASIYLSAIAGIQALALLALQKDERLSAVGPETWRKWVPVLVRYTFGHEGGVDLRTELFKRAYEIVADEVTSSILQVIDDENERSGHLFVVREIELCWGERMEKALVEQLASTSLKPNVFGGLLELLLQHQSQEAQKIARACIGASFVHVEEKESRMIAAAQALMKHTPDGGWDLIWPLIKGHAIFGRRIIESISFPDGGKANILAKLSERQLGELYLWMVENYPYGEQRSGFGFMAPGDTAPFLRDGILEHLKKRGTFAACDAIRTAMENFPQYGWMRHHLEEAEWFARAATWRPVSIQELLALVLDRDKRLVETGVDLTEAILESLKRLNAKLHGELPAAKDLWNEWNKVFRPKDEQDLSVYVARHLGEDLRDRGIVVNREVQIRRGIGGGTGQLTDIHVDAIVPDERNSYDNIHVIVEVKGNWNSELWTAMRTQLRDRYLKENRCREGLYLVGWFGCARWDDADVRKGHVPKLLIQQVRQDLESEAARLSEDGYSLRSYVLDVTLS